MTRIIYKYLIYLVFVITPTTLGIFIHLTFNNKFPAGGIFVFFLLVFIIGFRVRYTRIHFWILVYLLINIGYFLISILYFNDLNNTLLMNNFIILTMSILMPFTVFIFYDIIVTYRINIRKFILLISIGSLYASFMNFSIYRMVDLSSNRANMYEIRSEIYKLNQKIKKSKNQINLSNFQKILFKHFEAMGGTTGMGPLSALLGILLSVFGFLNKNKFISIAGMLSLIAAFFMVSRSSIVSIVIGVLSYILVKLYIKNKKKFILGFFISSVVAVFALCIAVFLSHEVDIFNRFQLERLLNEPRLKIWRGILYLVALNPFGYGFDYIRIAQNINSDYMLSLGINYTHAHNVYFNALINFGVIGLLVLVMMFYIILKESFKNIIFYKNKDKELYNMSMALFCALIVSYVHFMFEDLFLTYEAIYGGTFWLLVTIVAVMTHNRKNFK